MIHNKNKLSDYMSNFCTFHDEWFFCSINDKNRPELNYSKETFIQYLLIKNIITDPDTELTTEIADTYAASTYLEMYIRNTELPCDELNVILLNAFVSKLNRLRFSQEGSKKLMRVVKIDSEFYFAHVDKLSKYYNILKRNNPELKDDGAKLLTVLTVEKPTLEMEIDDKYNLSSKKCLDLNMRYYFTHFYHFNWGGLESKYYSDLKEKFLSFFNSDKASRDQVYDIIHKEIHTLYNADYVFKKAYKFGAFKDENELYRELIRLQSFKLESAKTIDEVFRSMIVPFDRISYNFKNSSAFLKIIQELLSNTTGLQISISNIEKINEKWGGYWNAPRQQMEKIFKEIEDEKANGNPVPITQDNFDDVLSKILSIK